MKLKEARRILNEAEAFYNRLKNLKKIYENKQHSYPMNLKCVGYPPLKVDSREELKGRIKELEDLLNVDLEEENGR